MKFYEDFVAWGKKFFSVETEAEIHQATQQFTTLAEMQDSLKAAALSAVQDQMTTLQTSLDSLTAQFTDLQASLAAKETELATANENLTALQATVTAKETELATAKTALETEKAQVTKLAGENAALIAGKPKEQDPNGGGTVTGERPQGTPKANVVETTVFQDYFAGKN